MSMEALLQMWFIEGDIKLMSVEWLVKRKETTTSLPQSNQHITLWCLGIIMTNTNQ